MQCWFIVLFRRRNSTFAHTYMLHRVYVKIRMAKCSFFRFVTYAARHHLLLPSWQLLVAGTLESATPWWESQMVHGYAPSYKLNIAGSGRFMTILILVLLFMGIFRTCQVVHLESCVILQNISKTHDFPSISIPLHMPSTQGFEPGETVMATVRFRDLLHPDGYDVRLPGVNGQVRFFQLCLSRLVSVAVLKFCRHCSQNPRQHLSVAVEMWNVLHSDGAEPGQLPSRWTTETNETGRNAHNACLGGCLVEHFVRRHFHLFIFMRLRSATVWGS